MQLRMSLLSLAVVLCPFICHCTANLDDDINFVHRKFFAQFKRRGNLTVEVSSLWYWRALEAKVNADLTNDPNLRMIGLWTADEYARVGQALEIS